MGWSAYNIERLEAGTIEPIFVLEFVDGTSYGNNAVGEAYKIASHPDVYGADEITIAADGVKTGSCSVTPTSWNYTAGAWSVDIVGSVGSILNYVTRGSLARLKIYWSAYDASVGQPGIGMSIALGVLQNISGKPPRYTLQFWDIITAIAGRRDREPLDARLIDSVPLFWRSYTTASLTSSLSSGAGACGINTDDDFADQASATVPAIAKVEPTGGDPYYISYTGTLSGPQLTGLSHDINGTTTVTAVSGDTVTSCGWLYGTVGTILKRLLTSTGTATNGSYDLYPASWGFGLPATWLDDSDMSEWTEAVIQMADTGSTIAAIWSTIIDAPITNPASWLSSYLSEAGVWLVTRQGEISFRCAQNPTGEPLLNDDEEEEPTVEVSSGPIESGFHITDADISEIVSHVLFDPSVPAESGRHIVLYHDTDSTTSSPESTYGGISQPTHTLDTFPGVSTTFTDLGDRLFHDNNSMARGADYRLGVWNERVPEKLQLRCAGLRLAQLVPGDLVNLTTDRIVGRPDPRFQVYQRRVCMVSSVSVNWSRPIVDITLSILPQSGVL